MGKRFIVGTAVALGLLAGQARAELIYLTNGASISRTDNNSLGAVTTVPITGMQLGETLTGIDVQPNAQARLFGIGSTSRMYFIDPLTGLATQVGTAGAFVINGTSFGMDFNPIPNRIRFVSNTEQNLRLNPFDGSLSGTDTALSPAGNIVATAYTNNVFNATQTTLYGIDSAAGTLVTIGSVNGTPNSPNGGLISTVGSLGLGTNLNEAIGFDISSSGLSFASITTGGVSRLYSINLSTGLATLYSSNGGTIGTGSTPFLGMTAAAPEPGCVALIGVAGMLILRRSRRTV